GSRRTLDACRISPGSGRSSRASSGSTACATAMPPRRARSTGRFGRRSRPDAPAWSCSPGRTNGIGRATTCRTGASDSRAPTGRPSPPWLTYLAATFLSTSHSAVGGPNIAPPGDGPIAECVARAPGGPVHVLLSDREAEHIPGCNMVFRKARLEAIGGFDPQFRTAGDDVDVCWRLQERGWTLGFSAAAVVWHHRRNSVRTYWKQQIGYGRAEAMLERKWPKKYNGSGHARWAGRIYGKGLTRA